jgi:peptide/nickel transport system permease protein
MTAWRVPSEQEHMVELHLALAKRFNKGELRVLCCYLEIEYDDLPGESRADKAKGLISYLERHGRISDLVRIGNQLHPDFSWDIGVAVSREVPFRFRGLPSGRLLRMRGLRRFLSSGPNLLALAIVVFFAFVAVAAPLLAPPDDPGSPSPYKVLEEYTAIGPLAPGQDVPLGTVVYYRADGRGAVTLLHFDVFHSLVWGARSALRFGLITALVAAFLGVLVGAASGYLGGTINVLTMRLTDAFLAFPVIAGVWLFRVLMQTADLEILDTTLTTVHVPASPFQKLVLALEVDPVMLTFIMFSWMPYARIINANVIRLKESEYVQAARVIGATPLRIISRHLIPNAIAPAVVLAARDIGGMVIMQAAFAFVGVSGTTSSVTIPEWARLLLLGRDWVIGQGGNPLLFWWSYVPATLALIVFGVGWNMLGDGLNTLLNPRESGRRSRK